MQLACEVKSGSFLYPPVLLKGMLPPFVLLALLRENHSDFLLHSGGLTDEEWQEK